MSTVESTQQLSLRRCVQIRGMALLGMLILNGLEIFTVKLRKNR